MLEGKSIKGFGIIDRGQDCGSTSVFQVGKDLLPYLHNHMCPTAAFHSPILVIFCCHFLHSPLQDIRLHDLTYKHGARNVPKVTKIFRMSSLWNNCDVFGLPDARPNLGRSDFIVDAA